MVQDRERLIKFKTSEICHVPVLQKAMNNDWSRNLLNVKNHRMHCIRIEICKTFNFLKDFFCILIFLQQLFTGSFSIKSTTLSKIFESIRHNKNRFFFMKTWTVVLAGYLKLSSFYLSLLVDWESKCRFSFLTDKLVQTLNISDSHEKLMWEFVLH